MKQLQMKQLQDVHGLVHWVTEAAFSASGAFIPTPIRGVIDRTLVDVACAGAGGVVSVAESLQVDAPAVDAWRSIGVPNEFRGRLTRLAVRPPAPHGCAA